MPEQSTSPLLQHLLGGGAVDVSVTERFHQDHPESPCWWLIPLAGRRPTLIVCPKFGEKLPAVEDVAALTRILDEGCCCV